MKMPSTTAQSVIKSAIDNGLGVSLLGSDCVEVGVVRPSAYADCEPDIEMLRYADDTWDCFALTELGALFISLDVFPNN